MEVSHNTQSISSSFYVCNLKCLSSQSILLHIFKKLGQWYIRWKNQIIDIYSTGRGIHSEKSVELQIGFLSLNKNEEFE